MKQRVRVLHVLPWIAGGGVERRRVSLSLYLPQTFEQQLFCLRGRGGALEALESAGAEVHQSTNGRVGSLKTICELLSIVIRFRPHIIHGAVFEGVRLGVIVGTLARTPVIIVEETSQATTRSSRGHRLFRTLCAFADQVVAISPQVAEMLVSTTGVPSKRIRVIMNGVEPLDSVTDEQRLRAKQSFGIPEDSFVLGTMSRLVDDSNKRVSDIIRALPKLLSQQPRAHLLVCGDGRHRERLARLACELDVAQHVTFAGTVEPSFEGFSAMDVFVHVASHEGFGLAVAEAAFCALPIVTTGVGGIASIVVPDETALIVPVGAPHAIAEAVTRLFDDAPLRQRLGEAGRARAIGRFSAQRYVRDVEAMYMELMAERGL